MPPPPYRADQVGSLLRPQYLLEARRRLEADEKDRGGGGGDAGLKKAVKDAEHRAITDVVAAQERRGIRPLTSGEFERPIFYGGFFEALEGMEVQFTEWSRFRTDFPTTRPLRKWGWTGRKVPVATARLKRGRSPYLDDWLFVRSLLPEARWGDVKITLPAPGWLHTQLKDGAAYAPGVYGSEEEYLRDLSEAVRQEILTLYQAGVRVVQIDDPNLTFFCDEDFVRQQVEEGTDMEALLDLHIQAHNDAIRDLPSDLKIGIHLCRGNFSNGVFLSSGGYDRVAVKLFHRLNYPLFYLEYDSDRAGDFTPLNHLPADKAIVLGIVTTKHSEMEDIHQLKARVYQAADVIAKGRGVSREEALRDNLAVSPQCGFASLAEGTGVGMDEEVQWKKLELLKRLADEIWPQ